jgi:hypothetical protein
MGVAGGQVGMDITAGVYNAPLAQCCLNDNVFQLSGKKIGRVDCMCGL